MARSVGEAAALGLESGFRLAMDYNEVQDRKARQKKLDAQSEADRERTQRRQDEADQLAALAGQEQMLATEGAGLAARATPPDEATQRDFTARVEGVRTAKGSLLAKRSGFDPLKAKKDAQADIEALKSGNIAALSPGGLTRATTVSTGRPPADYIRANGQASPIEMAGQDFVEGMEAGDEPRMLKGLNFLFQPQLQKGIGEKSPHGGTIVGKQFAGVVPDPNSDPNDPRVIPTLRVYVNNGKKEDSGDDVRARRAMADGAPAGATGYYLAPLTEGRSSDPNDKVKSIGMTQAMDYIGQHLQLAEILNTPDALARMKEEQDSGAWDSQQYLAALAGVTALAGTLTGTIDDTGRIAFDLKGLRLEPRQLVGKAQPFAVKHLVFVQHYGVFHAAALRQPH